jgi:hypothetical protein
VTSPDRIYEGSVRALSVVMLGLGLAILVITFAAGGSPLSIGFLLGIAFVVVGAGRLWLVSRMSR